MDSLTQIVLGASVGEAIAGKKIGNKAIIWGAIAGTIPDLDVLVSPWLDTVQELTFHRSVTHSLLFAVIVSPILGWLLKKLYPNQSATVKDWTLLFFLGFTTHAILDSFTTWGTQLFWPFSNYGVAFYNIFVVDPLYTVPFMAFVAAAMFYSRYSKMRSRLNSAGLIISSCYLAFSFIAKHYANNAFEESLREQNITYSDYISKPTPLNTIFWAVTVKTHNGFYTGFYSLLDSDKEINYDFEPQQKELLQPYSGNKKLEQLLSVTKGYYAVEPAKEGIYIKDLRFGKFDGWRKNGGQYVFVYHVWPNDKDKLVVEEINNRPKIDKSYLRDYFRRITGNKQQEN
ncbi:metal-dependent hydrolase [Pontibacter silvestris]|uniref:Metal-dependent hydrolase n=1 Tax=Pontibacter silvestris TaxID=2305183 RepID=A0ABW4WXQ4_9BACT|nr:metal-dependent hydrolase [Pontibacter silvestris]MCC9135365.1 metal-dependent hydrolase [Pontibacter silvestris]